MLSNTKNIFKRAQTRVVELTPSVKMEFVRVPAGEFLMGTATTKTKPSGSKLKEELAEQPQHRVHLDEYWIAKYPVTFIQYTPYMDAIGAHPSWTENYLSRPGHERQPPPSPAVFVSWTTAQDFCRWASETTGMHVRLPTEAEWEKAARGTDGRIYPWGNEKPDEKRCNLNLSGTTQVGRYSPQGDSPYGCADMAGNVAEWVADWFDADYYGNSPARNPTGPATGTARVLRGGFYGMGSDGVRSASRDRARPDNMSGYIGFRCVTTSRDPYSGFRSVMSLIESLLLTCVTIIAAALGKLLIGGITWLVSKIPVLGAILDFLEEVADINIVGILNLFIFAGLGLGIRKAATRSRLGRFGTVLSFILLILLAVVLFVSPRLVDYWLHVRDISVAQSTLFKEAIAAVDRNLLEEVGYSGFVGYYLAVVRGFWVRAANIFFFVVSLCLAILGWWDPKYSE